MNYPFNEVDQKDVDRRLDCTGDNFLVTEN